MTIMYKLVDQNWMSHGGMKWKIGQTNKAQEPGKKMCSNQVLHCYASPLQAVFLNPIHASIQTPILLEIECSKIINADGLKSACKEQTPLRELSLPILTQNQRVAVAIKLAMCGYQSPTWLKWAKDWLAGVKRTDASANANAADAAYADARATYAACANANAAYAATYAARAAVRAANDAAVRAARAAANAADAAYADANAANAAANATYAACANANAAYAAANAADAATYAVRAANDASADAYAAACADAFAADAATYAARAANATYAARAAFPNFLQETLEWAITNIE